MYHSIVQLTLTHTNFGLTGDLCRCVYGKKTGWSVSWPKTFQNSERILLMANWIYEELSTTKPNFNSYSIVEENSQQLLIIDNTESWLLLFQFFSLSSTTHWFLFILNFKYKYIAISWILEKKMWIDWC